MSIGSMFNQTCYPTQVEALTAACTSVNVFGADGSRVVCTGVQTTAPTPSDTAGGNFPGKLTVTRYDANGVATSMTPTITVKACERYDYAYWSDAMSAWVAAAVAIIAARMLYTRVFNRESL